MTASAIPACQFTFAAFHALTPDLLGHERAAVFHQLSPRLQREAWRDSIERARLLSKASFEEECR